MTALCLIHDINKHCTNVNNFLLWRYVKDEHKDSNGHASYICFSITTSDNGYLSFSHSNKTEWPDMLREIHKNIKVGGKSKPAIYMSFDVKEVYEEINTPNELVTFKSMGYPHIGMFYLSDLEDNEEKLIEVKTMLLELSSFYRRHTGGKVEEIK